MNIKKEFIISESHIKSSEKVYMIKPEKLREIVSQWIDTGVDLHISAVIGLDEPEKNQIIIYYYFMNRENQHPLILGVGLDRESPRVDTIGDLVGSTVYEGEVAEMFGVNFVGNDLTQVFLPDNWDYGYPLRKDWEMVEE